MNMVVVVNNASVLDVGDTAIIDRLETTLGHTVTVVSDHDAAPSLAGIDLVVISPTSNNNQVGTKYDDAPCGVFAMAVEPHSAFTSGTFAGGGGTQFDFNVEQPGDPLLGSITGTVNILTATPSENYTYFDNDALEPEIIEVLTRSTTRATLARAPQGAEMDGGTIAPTRRVFFGIGADWPTLFSADGWTIFENAVTYASVPPGEFPTADAGPDQEVEINDLVQLSGSGNDTDGTITGYTWRLISTSGPSVTLSNTSIANPTFTAPSTATTLIFGLRTTDNDGLRSTENTVRIDVISHMMARIAQGGTWVEKPIYVAKSGSWY